MLSALIFQTGNASAQECAGGSTNSNDESFACGEWALTIGNTSTAVGYWSKTGDIQSTAAGYSSITGGQSSTAYGAYTRAGGQPFGAEEGTVTVLSSGTTAIGTGAEAGAGAAGQDNATALGFNSTANALNATAVGAGATANFAGSTALGQGASTTRDNQVAIGTGANTYTMAGLASQASRDAQGTDDPVYLVTTDDAGNMATSTFDFASLADAPERLDQAEADISTHTTQIANHETRITNTETTVATHETRLDGHDLVLADHETRITNNTTAITELDGRVTNLEGSFADIDERISDNQEEARGGTALALAAAGLRFDDRPEKLSIAGGVGHFKGKTGLSLGFGYATSESLRFNAAIAGVPENGDVGFNAGMSWTLN